MGPMHVESIVGKRYVYTYVDDFPIFTWAYFLRTKSFAFEAFEELWQGLSKEHNNRLLKTTRIRSDYGKEFENPMFKSLCGKNGIKHEFSTPKTPQNNGVVERKNITLQEMGRVMLKSRNVLIKFWAEVENMACCISNRVYLRPRTHKTPYEI